MSRIPIALFNRRWQAEPLRQRLIAHGIQAEVHDELRLEKFWFVSRPTAGARLEVPAASFEEAYRRALDWDSSDRILRNAIRCPECRSLRVEYPPCTRESLIPNIVMGFLAMLGHVQKEYYCEDCHFTWPKEGSRPSKRRPHTAPHYFIEGVEPTALHPSKQPDPVARAGY